MPLNLHAIPPLVTSLLGAALGSFILTQKPASALKRIFAGFCFAISFWQMGYAGMYLSANETTATFWARFSYIGVVFLPSLFFHFAIQYAKQSYWQRFVLPCHGLSFIFLLLVWLTDYFVMGSRLYPWGYFVHAGPLEILFIVYLLSAFAISLATLFRYSKQVKEISYLEYNRIQYVFWAIFIGLFSAVDFLADYGIPIYPPAPFLTSFALVVLWYAVFKYQLLDIKLVIHRTLVYATLISCISIIYLLTVIFTEKWFQNILGYRSIGSTILAAILIAFAFQPLKARLEAWIARRFFKQLHLEILRENEKLQQQLRQSEKLAAIGQFAAGMIHEIRNPLSAIKTFVEYFPRYQSDPKFLQQFYQIVARETDRLHELISRVLGFAKPSTINPEEINPHDLLDKSLELLEAKLKQANINIEKLYAEGDHLVLPLDQQKMEEVFLNIFTNSIDAMPDGGQLIIQTQLSNRDFLIKISDSGCGMSGQVLEHLFEPFNTTKPNGTGLGMNIVKSIVDAHKGQIFVQSQAGQGTTVELRLPQ